MVKLYVKRIRDGKLTIEEVPEYWRDKVIKELKSLDTNGFDDNGGIY